MIEDAKKVDDVRDALARLATLAADTYWHGVPRIAEPVDTMAFMREHVLTGTPAVLESGSMPGSVDGCGVEKKNAKTREKKKKKKKNH
jgi:hypothetical protein